jgi:hypothetical protein
MNDDGTMRRDLCVVIMNRRCAADTIHGQTWRDVWYSLYADADAAHSEWSTSDFSMMRTMWACWARGRATYVE